MLARDSMPDLSWLADSPMFIDSQQISAFYDAVVGPAFRTVELQISEGQTGQPEKSVGARLGAGLPALFPWLKLNADVDAAKGDHKRSAGGQQHHLAAGGERRPATGGTVLALPGKPARPYLRGGPEAPASQFSAIAASPRMIAFVDAGPGTKFLPKLPSSTMGGSSRSSAR